MKRATPSPRPRSIDNAKARAAKKASAKPAAAKAARPRKTAPKSIPKSSARKVAKPKLLSGGNPQIAKAEGDAPVAGLHRRHARTGNSDVGRRLDALIERTVPGVRKAVKWNSPFYGVEGQGWFLSFHCFAKYVKLAFFRGASLRPVAARRVASRRTCATSTSARTMRSTRRSSRRG